MKMKIWLSTTNGRHEIDGTEYFATASGNTRKQLFINAIRMFNDYRADARTKEMVRSKKIRSFSKWEFMLSNSKNPGKQYGETEYWIRRNGTDWEILEFNSKWRGSIHDTIYTRIYMIPNAKVKHPYAEDFMVKMNDKM